MLVKNKTNVLISLLISTCNFLGAQARVILNDNSYLVLNGESHLVLSNSNPNAITVLGGGGNIVSESEGDVVDWKISGGTGTYNIPFTTASGVKIPLKLSILSSGVGNGEVLFSTHTDTDGDDSWNNIDYIPLGVTNLFGVNGLVNNSAYVIDRFWTINAQNYIAKPSGNLSFGYNDMERSSVGNNIPSSSLVAQYYNTSSNSWVYPGNGIDNYPLKTVSGVNTGAFYKSWTLSSFDNPLPIELLYFRAISREGAYVELSWSTISEIDNDFFSVQRSQDALNWEEIGVVTGLGTSVKREDYLLNDYSPHNGINYYRLEQFNFNGDSEYSEVKAVNYSGNEFINVYPNPSRGGMFNLIINLELPIDLIMSVYDNKGNVVYQKLYTEKEVRSQYTLDLSALSKGIYILSFSTINRNLKVHKKLIIY